MNAKKIIAIGVAAVSVSLFAENAVESSNVVGYMDYEQNTKYAVSGSMFVVPSGVSWKLNDLVMKGGDYENDYIQVMKPDNAQVDRAKTYYYDPDEGTWMYRNKDSGKQDEPIEDDLMIPAGAAFLCVFNSDGVSLTYSGEVQKGVSGKIVIERGAKYYFVANPLPYDIDLTDVKIVDGDYENDYIQFMKESVAQVDRAKTYYYDPDEKYWCYRNKDSGKQDEEVPEGEVTIKAGAGILAVFNTDEAKIEFPAPNL